MNFKAFSYNEILIVAGVAAIMLMISGPFYLQFINNNELSYTADLTLRYLRSAQNSALNSENDTDWGVCKSGTTIIMYKSSCAQSNYIHTFTLKSGVTINGLIDLKFTKNTGEPTAIATINILAGGKTRSIALNKVGGYVIN